MEFEDISNSLPPVQESLTPFEAEIAGLFLDFFIGLFNTILFKRAEYKKSSFFFSRKIFNLNLAFTFHPQVSRYVEDCSKRAASFILQNSSNGLQLNLLTGTNIVVQRFVLKFEGKWTWAKDRCSDSERVAYPSVQHAQKLCICVLHGWVCNPSTLCPRSFQASCVRAGLKKILVRLNDPNVSINLPRPAGKIERFIITFGFSRQVTFDASKDVIDASLLLDPDVYEFPWTTLKKTCPEPPTEVDVKTLNAEDQGLPSASKESGRNGKASHEGATTQNRNGTGQLPNGHLPLIPALFPVETAILAKRLVLNFYVLTYPEEVVAEKNPKSKVALKQTSSFKEKHVYQDQSKRDGKLLNRLTGPEGTSSRPGIDSNQFNNGIRTNHLAMPALGTGNVSAVSTSGNEPSTSNRSAKSLTPSPQRLLQTLSPLLDPNSGSIKSEADVPTLMNVMTQYSRRLVNKCVFINVLNSTTSTQLMNAFLHKGGWSLLHKWTKEGIERKNRQLLTEILMLLLKIPVTPLLLRQNNLRDLVKLATTTFTDETVKSLGLRLCASWDIIFNQDKSGNTTPVNEHFSNEFNLGGTSELHKQIITADTHLAELISGLSSPTAVVSAPTTEGSSKERNKSGSLLTNSPGTFLRAPANEDLNALSSHSEPDWEDIPDHFIADVLPSSGNDNDDTASWNTLETLDSDILSAVGHAIMGGQGSRTATSQEGQSKPNTAGTSNEVTPPDCDIFPELNHSAWVDNYLVSPEIETEITETLSMMGQTLEEQESKKPKRKYSDAKLNMHPIVLLEHVQWPPPSNLKLSNKKATNVQQQKKCKKTTRRSRNRGWSNRTRKVLPHKRAPPKSIPKSKINSPPKPLASTSSAKSNAIDDRESAVEIITLDSDDDELISKNFENQMQQACEAKPDMASLPQGALVDDSAPTSSAIPAMIPAVVEPEKSEMGHDPSHVIQEGEDLHLEAVECEIVQEPMVFADTLFQGTEPPVPPGVVHDDLNTVVQKIPSTTDEVGIEEGNAEIQADHDTILQETRELSEVIEESPNSIDVADKPISDSSEHVGTIQTPTPSNEAGEIFWLKEVRLVRLKPEKIRKYMNQYQHKRSDIDDATDDVEAMAVTSKRILREPSKSKILLPLQSESMKRRTRGQVKVTPRVYRTEIVETEPPGASEIVLPAIITAEQAKNSATCIPSSFQDTHKKAMDRVRTGMSKNNGTPKSFASSPKPVFKIPMINKSRPNHPAFENSKRKELECDNELPPVTQDAKKSLNMPQTKNRLPSLSNRKKLSKRPENREEDDRFKQQVDKAKKDALLRRTGLQRESNMSPTSITKKSNTGEIMSEKQNDIVAGNAAPSTDSKKSKESEVSDENPKPVKTSKNSSFIEMIGIPGAVDQVQVKPVPAKIVQKQSDLPKSLTKPSEDTTQQTSGTAANENVKKSVASFLPVDNATNSSSNDVTEKVKSTPKVYKTKRSRADGLLDEMIAELQQQVTAVINPEQPSSEPTNIKRRKEKKLKPKSIILPIGPNNQPIHTKDPIVLSTSKGMETNNDKDKEPAKGSVEEKVKRKSEDDSEGKRSGEKKIPTFKTPIEHLDFLMGFDPTAQSSQPLNSGEIKSKSSSDSSKDKQKEDKILAIKRKAELDYQLRMVSQPKNFVEDLSELPSTSDTHVVSSTSSITKPSTSAPALGKNGPLTQSCVFDTVLHMKAIELDTKREQILNNKIRIASERKGSLTAEVQSPTEDSKVSPASETEKPDTPKSGNSGTLKAELKGILVLHNERERQKKKVQWKNEDELETIHEFEMDFTERVNVARTSREDFLQMQKEEHSKEREANVNLASLASLSREILWTPPRPIEFPPSQPKPTIKSKEKAIQEEREQHSLGTIYFWPRDIPFSPAEPDPVDDEVVKKPPIMIPVKGKKGTEKAYNLNVTEPRRPMYEDALVEAETPIVDSTTSKRSHHETRNRDKDYSHGRHRENHRSSPRSPTYSRSPRYDERTPRSPTYSRSPRYDERTPRSPSYSRSPPYEDRRPEKRRSTDSNDSNQASTSQDRRHNDRASESYSRSSKIRQETSDTSENSSKRQRKSRWEDASPAIAGGGGGPRGWVAPNLTVPNFSVTPTTPTPFSLSEQMHTAYPNIPPPLPLNQFTNTGSQLHMPQVPPAVYPQQFVNPYPPPAVAQLGTIPPGEGLPLQPLASYLPAGPVLQYSQVPYAVPHPLYMPEPVPPPQISVNPVPITSPPVAAESVPVSSGSSPPAPAVIPPRTILNTVAPPPAGFSRAPFKMVIGPKQRPPLRKN